MPSGTCAGMDCEMPYTAIVPITATAKADAAVTTLFVVDGFGLDMEYLLNIDLYVSYATWMQRQSSFAQTHKGFVGICD